jgi:hypothetical protein
MGHKGSKYKSEDVDKLGRLYPEPDYVIKTRPPMPGKHFLAFNKNRGLEN